MDFQDAINGHKSSLNFSDFCNHSLQICLEHRFFLFTVGGSRFCQGPRPPPEQDSSPLLLRFPFEHRAGVRTSYLPLNSVCSGFSPHPPPASGRVPEGVDLRPLCWLLPVSPWYIRHWISAWHPGGSAQVHLIPAACPHTFLCIGKPCSLDKTCQFWWLISPGWNKPGYPTLPRPCH